MTTINLKAKPKLRCISIFVLDYILARGARNIFNKELLAFVKP